MNKIKIYLIVFALISGFAACTDNFEEINTNVNKPTLSQAAPDMLLTNSIESMTDRVHEIFLGHEMGSCWVQHVAKVQYTDEDRYIPRVSVINRTWESLYASSGQDVATIIDIAEAKELKNYKGIAYILKAYITSVLTDLYGDIPYSKAWKGSSEEAIVSPAYDTQESIYTDLVLKLKEANDLLSDSNEAVKGDILYNGDITKWKKFANSLRLRLLLRMSAKKPVGAEMQAILSAPATYPIFASNADNAALVYLGAAPNNNPIHENRKTRDDHRVSKTLIDFLYVNPASPDYRVSLYAELAEGKDDYNGLPNGLRSADAAAYDENGLKNTSKIGSFYAQATAPGILMSYAELQFILAEAAFKNYISGGVADAEKYYNKGIEVSYYQNEDYFSTVLTKEWKSTFISWGWDEKNILAYALEDFIEYGGWKFNPAKAMEQIGSQKWVALFDQGLQANFEQRRIGFPILVAPAASATQGKIPVRVFYPSDEYARNKTNVEAAVARQGKDDMNTKVWWNK
ncbi:MAG: SusD/RagB family nutrient-binding outer membrane lipoprotein [Paludibacter sp.]|nr:SusD/RagB family nutrient-binding outer membrane lipoprotein [Paludibacter sp.]